MNISNNMQHVHCTACTTVIFIKRLIWSRESKFTLYIFCAKKIHDILNWNSFPVINILLAKAWYKFLHVIHRNDRQIINNILLLYSKCPRNWKISKIDEMTKTDFITNFSFYNKRNYQQIKIILARTKIIHFLYL